MIMDKSNVGNKLKTLRERKGYTHEEVAYKCDLSTTEYNELESGKRYPSDTSLAILCEVYGITQMELQRKAFVNHDKRKSIINYIQIALATLLVLTYALPFESYTDGMSGFDMIASSGASYSQFVIVKIVFLVLITQLIAHFLLYTNFRKFSNVFKTIFILGNSLSVFLLLPIFSMISLVYFKTPSLEDLVFTTSSNFATSGGFGPNQVSTMIGVGTFIIAIFIILRVELSKYLFLDILFLAYFTYRGLLTFSRGGMLTAGVAFITFIVCIVLHKRLTFKKLFLYTSVSFALFMGVWLYTTNITGGLISNRYAGKNVKGVQKKDATAGRAAIFEAQLESFYKSPFFGIGVGNGKYKRMQSNIKTTAAAHNEISRLLEEQGILGFIALLILLFKPLVNIYFGTMYQRSFLISFYIFWFLTINHSAMRLAFPGFIYGLSLIKITTDHE